VGLVLVQEIINMLVSADVRKAPHLHMSASVRGAQFDFSKNLRLSESL
jgi:hypothetical protein